MRKIFRSLSAKKQNAILQRQGIPRADWDARAKRIDRGFWKSLSAKGAPFDTSSSRDAHTVSDHCATLVSALGMRKRMIVVR